MSRARFHALLGRLYDAAGDLERANAALPAQHWHPDVRPLLTTMDTLVHLLRGTVDHLVPADA